jgi:MFS family permease
MNESKQPSGMKGFTIVWVGQAISLLGTAMTGFAVTIWAFDQYKSATALALAGLFFTLPLLIMSPFAGALVDRSNRKFMMMISDLASGLVTIAFLVLYLTGSLNIWHIYIGNFISGTFQAFQWPAYSAAITMIVPKKHYARASALNDLAGNASGIFAPMLAGALLPFINLAGILAIDIISFVFAIGALLIVHIPQPEATAEGKEASGSFFKEAFYGFYYIFKRKSLLGLQLVFLVGNFFATIAFTLVAPMILFRTNSNTLILGSFETMGAVGGVLGGLAMGAWGGFKRKKVHGVLSGWAVSSVLGTLLIGLGRSLPVWGLGSFFSAFFVPLINSSNQAIWQSKVSPDLQGRVFATRRLIAWGVTPLANLIAGPLADRVMGPAMLSGGALTGAFGWLTGVGPGAGISLIIVFCSFATLVVGLGGYLFPAVRNAETILPDHQVAAADEQPTAGDRTARLQELLETRARLIAETPSEERDLALKAVSYELREIGRERAVLPSVDS